MKKIYIASPYTKGEPIINVRWSLEVADELLRLGFTPFAPLLSHFWHFFSPKPWETWTKYDLEWIESCDALLRLEGESEGADLEVARARELGIPVFHSVRQLVDATKKKEAVHLGTRFMETARRVLTFAEWQKVVYAMEKEE